MRRISIVPHRHRSRGVGYHLRGLSLVLTVRWRCRVLTVIEDVIEVFNASIGHDENPDRSIRSGELGPIEGGVRNRVLGGQSRDCFPRFAQVG
jgi:hypothetical protein